MTINYFNVLVITIVLNIIGFIWYGPLFGKAWRRVMSNDPSVPCEDGEQNKKGMCSAMFVNFILSLVTVVVLSWALAGEHNVVTAIKLSVIIWFGFVMTMNASAALWSGKSKKLSWEMFLITAGYQLVAFIVAGAIIALW